MKADWVDEAQEVTQLMVDCQVDRIRQAFLYPAVSPAECEQCGNPIPAARRQALPGVRRCVECQAIREFNLRVGVGDKDEE